MPTETRPQGVAAYRRPVTAAIARRAASTSDFHRPNETQDTTRRLSAGTTRCARIGRRRVSLGGRKARADSVDERLHPEAVIEAIAATGKQTFYEEECRRDLAPLLRKNDIVVVF